MKNRILILLDAIFISIFIILFPVGCQNSPSASPPSISSTPTIYTNNAPIEPISITVIFANGAPSLNQIAELRCNIKSQGLKDNTTLRLNVDLPSSFQLVQGALSWQGSVASESEVTAIDITIKAIQIGQWTINTYSHGISVPLEGYKINGTHPIYVDVEDNSAEWGITPPWANHATTIPVTTQP
jgi:hypothetical protein